MAHRFLPFRVPRRLSSRRLQAGEEATPKNSSLSPLTLPERETEMPALGPWEARGRGKEKARRAFIGPFQCHTAGRWGAERGRPFPEAWTGGLLQAPAMAWAACRHAGAARLGPRAPLPAGGRGDRLLSAPGVGGGGETSASGWEAPRPLSAPRPWPRRASIQPGDSSPHLLHCLH